MTKCERSARLSANPTALSAASLGSASLTDVYNAHNTHIHHARDLMSMLISPLPPRRLGSDLLLLIVRAKETSVHILDISHQPLQVIRWTPQ